MRGQRGWEAGTGASFPLAHTVNTAVGDVQVLSKAGGYPKLGPAGATSAFLCLGCSSDNRLHRPFRLSGLTVLATRVSRLSHTNLHLTKEQVSWHGGMDLSSQHL